MATGATLREDGTRHHGFAKCASEAGHHCWGQRDWPRPGTVAVYDLERHGAGPRLGAALAPVGCGFTGATLKRLALDGTSLLNLRQAGVSESEWIIAVTSSDEVNVEICRLALSVEHPPAAVAVVQSLAAQSQLKELGAEVLLRPLAMAGLVSNVIERGVRIAVSVGLGRGEVLEIPVLPTSPAVDRRVADLRARRWLIAAIYRQDQIIVPHGDAVVRAGDRLLLSGEPDILPDIADYLRAGVARFPLQYGRQLVFAEDGSPSAGVWREAAYLADKTRVDGVTLLPVKSASGQRPEVAWSRPVHTLEGHAHPLMITGRRSERTSIWECW
jgi:Trk K+ transport system NAD-binding subunit